MSAALIESSVPVVVVPPAAADVVRAPAGIERPILCAHDLSDDGDRAACVAAQLSARMGLELVLLHVLAAQPSSVPRLGPGLSASPEDDLRRLERENEVLRTLRGRAASLDRPARYARRRVEAGFPADGVEHAAAAEDASLVVVGSSGQSGLRAAVRGSTSFRLARRGSRPLVMVPPGASSLFEPERHSARVIPLWPTRRAADRQQARVGVDQSPAPLSVARKMG
jgi:nucleotide-binding universal stress UspA family protein